MKIITTVIALFITYLLFVSSYWISIAILPDTGVDGIWMAMTVILTVEVIGLMVLLRYLKRIENRVQEKTKKE